MKLPTVSLVREQIVKYTQTPVHNEDHLVSSLCKYGLHYQESAPQKQKPLDFRRFISVKPLDITKHL